MIRLELEIIRSWIDRNANLNLTRTGSYLKYVARFWSSFFDTPLHDIDQFRLFLADKNYCALNSREKIYAAQCRAVTNAVYAILVDEALRSPAPMDVDAIERQAEKLLQSTPPFPIVFRLQKIPVSAAVRRRVGFYRHGQGWIGIVNTAEFWPIWEQFARVRKEA